MVSSAATMSRRGLFSKLCGSVVAGGVLALPSRRIRADADEPVDSGQGYDVAQVEGWQVQVNRQLREQEHELGEQVLKVLAGQLFDITRRVPPRAVAKLRQVVIWVELNDPNHPGGVYHPSATWLRNNGMNPEKARCVEFANARNFLTGTIHQPAMVLHELAHAYHHQFLEGGYGNQAIREAYERAKEAGLYDQVLTIQFRTRRAYAMTDPMEYFAESTEAFFGTNDFYPFVVAELRDHDPKMYELVRELWNQ